MSENKYLQVRKENVFSRLFSFIKNLFKTNQETRVGIIKIENKNTKNKFIEEIRINKKADPELMKLQEKFENRKINLAVMSDEEVHSLHLLYKRQISDLKKKLENKETDLNIIKHNIKGISTNM